jgi:hypothetical protein
MKIDEMEFTFLGEERFLLRLFRIIWRRHLPLEGLLREASMSPWPSRPADLAATPRDSVL